MPVYFIRGETTGFTKIGWAQKPAARLVSLQGAHWEKLALIRVCQGTMIDERKLHRHYKSKNVFGEWFRFCESMMTIDPATFQQDGEAKNLPLEQKTYYMLREWRRMNKLSQREFANRLAVTKYAVSRWENGSRMPSYKLMFAIEDMTGGQVPARGWL